MTPKIEKTDAEWKQILTPEQYQILREHGTEPAFQGIYTDTDDDGMYKCAACQTSLFTSDTKFHSGSGWPSFFQPFVNPDGSANIETQDDFTYGMQRTEVHCSVCGSHLGHVFTDGPTPTGLRYCVNSVSLKLDTGAKEPEAGDQVSYKAE